MSTDTFIRRPFPMLDNPREQQAKEAAAARGYAAGYATGLRAAEQAAAELREQLRAEHEQQAHLLQERTAQALAVLSSGARAVEAAAIPVIQEAQDVLVAVAMDLAEVIIGFQLADRDLAARAALARATSIPGCSPVSVRLHPDDIAALHRARAVPGDLVLTPDASLVRGDAVAALEDGFLDARLTTAVERARGELVGTEQTQGLPEVVS